MERGERYNGNAGFRLHTVQMQCPYSNWKWEIREENRNNLYLLYMLPVF